MGRTKIYSEAWKILSNQEICPGYHRMRIACGQAFQEAIPGQFVMIRLKNQVLPLLRRPFSIHDVIFNEDRVIAFEILYKIVGEGTKALSLSGAGDTLHVLGPLGRGFTTRKNFNRIHMVAGGIGVAPFVFLTHHLIRQGISGSQIKLFMGGRSSDDLLCLEIFERLHLGMHLTTDDGSSGDQCLVTQPLDDTLTKDTPDILYACGPIPMLREVMIIAAKASIPCQVSIETMMACGMGVCLGCAVEQQQRKDSYLHACLNGPVFDADTIKL